MSVARELTGGTEVGILSTLFLGPLFLGISILMFIRIVHLYKQKGQISKFKEIQDITYITGIISLFTSILFYINGTFFWTNFWFKLNFNNSTNGINYTDFSNILTIMFTLIHKYMFYIFHTFDAKIFRDAKKKDEMSKNGIIGICLLFFCYLVGFILFVIEHEQNISSIGYIPSKSLYFVSYSGNYAQNINHTTALLIMNMPDCLFWILLTKQYLNVRNKDIKYTKSLVGIFWSGIIYILYVLFLGHPNNNILLLFGYPLMFFYFMVNNITILVKFYSNDAVYKFLCSPFELVLGCLFCFHPMLDIVLLCNDIQKCKDCLNRKSNSRNIRVNSSDSELSELETRNE